LVEQPRFRAGFDFMRLRADVGELDVVLADWWQEFSQASDDLREDLVAQLREEQHRGQRRVRSPRPERSSAQDVAPQTDAPEPNADEAAPSDAPRKRRRRRRKSSGPGQGDDRPAAE
jgi:poly(A) polymerase